jgi:hypothetical protein
MTDAPDPLAMIGRSRETEIRRDAQGRWWNGSDPITHALLTKSFDGWIERAEDGRFCLKNDINWAYVAIEGPPYFVRSLRLDPSGDELSIDRVTLHLSGDLEAKLDPSSLREANDGSLHCTVRGDLLARFDSHASMQLEPLLVQTSEGLALRGDGGRTLRVPAAM